jgi:ABC-type glutathione transport system ATPase component
VQVLSPGAAVRQCIGMARTVLLRRPLVLLDEPTSCQSPAVARHQAKALRNGACRWQPPGAAESLRATVVVCTRSPMVVAEMDLAFVLSHGCVVEAGTPRALLRRPAHLAQHFRQQAEVLSRSERTTAGPARPVHQLEDGQVRPLFVCAQIHQRLRGASPRA